MTKRADRDRGILVERTEWLASYADNIRSMPIGLLVFRGVMDVRIKNVCAWESITTLGQALDRSDEEWLRTPNFGRKCLVELKRVAAEYGI